MLLFDGDCAFCSRCAALAERWVPTPASIRPWQRVDLAALGLTPRQCDQSVQWVASGAAGRRHTEGPAAIADLLRSSTAVTWRWVGRALGSPPGLAVAAPLYRWVARHRHHMPGGTAACAVPAFDRPERDAG